MKNSIIILLAFVALQLPAFAQNASGPVPEPGSVSESGSEPFCIPNESGLVPEPGPEVFVEASGTVSDGDFSPFYLTANRHGRTSWKPKSAYVTAGINQTDRHFGEIYPSTGSRFSRGGKRFPQWMRDFKYGYGIELQGAWHGASWFNVQQAYGEISWKKMRLTVGAKERGSENLNDYLSMGGLAVSANARPVPQVRGELTDWVPMRKGSWLQFRGHLAYGRFTDDVFQRRYKTTSHIATNVLYHSKSFFMSAAPRHTGLRIQAGFEHMVQFGGTCRYPSGRVTKSPATFGDFFRVFVGMPGSDSASLSDQINVAGNHLGVLSAAIAWKSNNYGIRLYGEHPFEDKSGMRPDFGFWTDHLLGIEINLPSNRVLSSFVFELLSTKRQTGALFVEGAGMVAPGHKKFTGCDNYYNNGQYAGWEHWGMTMGNPMLTSPVYNRDGDLSIRNNRLQAFHFGLSGEPCKGVMWRALVTSSRNLGTYARPFLDIIHNTSALLEVSWKPSKADGWAFTLSGAADIGGLFGHNYGGMLTVRKSFNLAKTK